MKLVCENLNDILKPKELSLQRKLEWACSELDIYAVQQALEEGAEITYKIYNYLSADRWYNKKKVFLYKLMTKFFPEYAKEKDVPKILLKQSLDEDSFKLFKEALEKGAKLNISIFKEIKDKAKYDNDYKKWVDFIIKGKKEFFNPKSLKMIEDRYLNLSPELPARSYPKGYMQYRALKLINDQRIDKRSDIIKLLYELRYGPNTYNPTDNSGYWSTSYPKIIKQFYNVLPSGRFQLRREGRAKLAALHNKFTNMNDERLENPYV